MLYRKDVLSKDKNDVVIPAQAGIHKFFDAMDSCLVVKSVICLGEIAVFLGIRQFRITMADKPRGQDPNYPYAKGYTCNLNVAMIKT